MMAHGRVPTQKIAPTAVVSMAVLMSLLMIMPVFGNSGCQSLSPEHNKRKRDLLLKPVLLRHKKKKRMNLKNEPTPLSEQVDLFQVTTESMNVIEDCRKGQLGG